MVKTSQGENMFNFLKRKKILGVTFIKSNKNEWISEDGNQQLTFYPWAKSWTATIKGVDGVASTKRNALIIARKNLRVHEIMRAQRVLRNVAKFERSPAFENAPTLPEIELDLNEFLVDNTPPTHPEMPVVNEDSIFAKTTSNPSQFKDFYYLKDLG